MGLLYLMPAKEAEVEHVKVADDHIYLKSYGLPPVFWGYLFVIYMVSFFMFLGVKWPLQKMISQQDPINQYIAYCVYILLIGTPIAFTFFYFYKKTFLKKRINNTKQ